MPAGDLNKHSIFALHMYILLCITNASKIGLITKITAKNMFSLQYHQKHYRVFFYPTNILGHLRGGWVGVEVTPNLFVSNIEM